MSDLTSAAGEIHKRLIQNLCPKCETFLQVVEKTEEKLHRRCLQCKLEILKYNLDIHDRMPDAEYPSDLCD